MATGCEHTITAGRAGEKGDWCVNCGIKVHAVHDRACGECIHHKRIGADGFGGHSICRKHLMAVTTDMHVTYSLLKRDGLCFEENRHD